MSNTYGSKLFEDMSLAKGDGGCLKMFSGFAKTDLLVLYDYRLVALNQEQCHDYLKILEGRLVHSSHNI